MATDFHARVRELLREHPHVTLDIDVKTPDLVSVERIWSEVERGAGHAGRAIRALIELADEEGVALTLVPHWLAYETEHLDDEEANRLDALNEKRLDNAQLHAWYERLGFVATGETSGDDPVMVRPPAPAPRPTP